MMRQFFLTTEASSFDWLVFLGFLLLTCLVLAGVVVWFKALRSPARKPRRKRRSRHHRDGTPASRPLSISGGLPPRRDDASPPPPE